LLFEFFVLVTNGVSGALHEGLSTFYTVDSVLGSSTN